jgi:hypothetical protein
MPLSISPLLHRLHAVAPVGLGALAAVVVAGCGPSPAAALHDAPTATPTLVVCRSSVDSWAYLDTVAQLKQKAQVIVVGTVVSSTATRDTPCTVHTDATVRVDRTVYDPQQQVTGGSLVVRTKGGVLGTFGEWVEDEAQLAVGDQVVLFLVPDTATWYEVVDGEQGAIHILDGMVQPLSGDGPSPTSLDAYLERIQRA